MNHQNKAVMKKSIYSLVILGALSVLPVKNVNDKSFSEFLQESICNLKPHFTAAIASHLFDNICEFSVKAGIQLFK